MEINEKLHRKKGRPLKKRRSFPGRMRHKLPEAPDDSISGNQDDSDDSNHQGHSSEDNGTADCPQDSVECVVNSTMESSDGSSNGDPITCEEPSINERLPNPSVRLDCKRIRRLASKRKKESKECCPVCSLTLREPDLEAHLDQEIEKLSNISRKYNKLRRNEDGINTEFVQVKCNRENRVTAKLAHCIQSAPKKVQCPICKDRISGTEEEINNHVDFCADMETHVVVDEEYESSYEEFEIGDETRIRAASLIPGGYRSLFGQTCTVTCGDDIDVEVDVDDTIEYGSPHELDVISDSNHADERSELLRRSVVNNPETKPNVLVSRKWSDASDAEEVEKNSIRSDLEKILNDADVEKTSIRSDLEKIQNAESFSTKDVLDVPEEGSEHSEVLICSLKEKIRTLEKQNKNNLACLICLEPYSTPLVSTTCWHVHCEECWLKNMGEKKLCPQCNMIVFPSNLRKIYL